MECLLINQSTPLENYNAQEMLDLALALTTFEQTVQLLFIGNAVFQLLKQQQPNIGYRKDFIATFKALSMYDIKNVFVDEDSLNQYNLNTNDLIIDVNVTTKENIVKIMETVDVVLNI